MKQIFRLKQIFFFFIITLSIFRIASAKSKCADVFGLIPTKNIESLANTQEMVFALKIGEELKTFKISAKTEGLFGELDNMESIPGTSVKSSLVFTYSDFVFKAPANKTIFDSAEGVLNIQRSQKGTSISIKLSQYGWRADEVTKKIFDTLEFYSNQKSADTRVDFSRIFVTESIDFFGNRETRIAIFDPTVKEALYFFQYYNFILEQPFN